MTTHDHSTTGRRSFFARLLAGAGALAAAVGTSRVGTRPPRAGGPARGRAPCQAAPRCRSSHIRTEHDPWLTQTRDSGRTSRATGGAFGSCTTAGPSSEQKAHEFMAGVTDGFDLGQLSTMSRKRFLALLSASAAFAATGCTNYRDKGEIVPYTKKPEEIVPGVANLYASTCTGCSQQCGILVKTREGRPIKIDGNPEHPINRGKICATGQASILNLYDPASAAPPDVRRRARARSATPPGRTSMPRSPGSSRAASRRRERSRSITHAVTSPTARARPGGFPADVSRPHACIRTSCSTRVRANGRGSGAMATVPARPSCGTGPT